MVTAAAKGLILPPDSLPRIKLEGETLAVKILAYGQWECWVEYPDGHRRHHQASDVVQLLGKIHGQLIHRYNIDAFAFKAIPKSISAGETVIIGEIKYA